MCIFLIDPPHALLYIHLSALGEEKIIFYSTQAVACPNRSLGIHFFTYLGLAVKRVASFLHVF